MKIPAGRYEAFSIDRHAECAQCGEAVIRVVLFAFHGDITGDFDIVSAEKGYLAHVCQSPVASG